MRGVVIAVEAPPDRLASCAVRRTPAKPNATAASTTKPKKRCLIVILLSLVLFGAADLVRVAAQVKEMAVGIRDSEEPPRTMRCIPGFVDIHGHHLAGRRVVPEILFGDAGVPKVIGRQRFERPGG